MESEEKNKWQDDFRAIRFENGCPICGWDVIGNEVYRYYCKNCNLLFRGSELSIKTPLNKTKRPSEVSGKKIKINELKKEFPAPSEKKQKRDRSRKRKYCHVT